jgi:apolipoprotein N-acyltransferase
MISTFPPTLSTRARFALALSSAGLYVLLFPKFDFSFLAWGAFGPFLLNVYYTSRIKSFGWAVLTGFLANLGTLYWVYPTCRTGGVDAPASLLAVTALALYLGLYWGVFALALRAFDDGPAWMRPFLAAAAWTALEWARAWAFTGFPWLLLAASQWTAPRALALAEWGGAYAVSFWIMLANASLAGLVRDTWERRWDRLRRFFAPAAAVFLLGYVTFRLDARDLVPAGFPMSVSIVQGNIDQYKKWDQAYEEEIVRVYAGLTREAAASGPDLIVWPETAVPGWVPNESRYEDWLKGLARESGAHLLAGAATHQPGGDYNAAFLYGPSGDGLGQYRKRHLVPFGEFVPFQKYLARWVGVLNELGDFAGSNDWTVFRVGQAKLSVNICFESLFPDLIRRFVRRGAQLTVNITNDGWYLDTAAPAQHLSACVLRAVETRTWVVRAANTGISALVDPRGNVTARTELMARTVLHGRVQPMTGNTFYVARGDVWAAACAGLAGLGLLAAFVRAVRRRFRRGAPARQKAAGAA